MDDQPGRTPPPARPKRGKGEGRNPGKQPGAPGSHLAWSENPGRTVPHFPQGTCACGADLARAADLGVAASHQKIEIPLMTAAVIQHDVHEVACGCGRVHDRYQNYDSPEFAGVRHQLCCQHLLRDLADAAENYPGAIWPRQAADALRALIHPANLAREQGLPAVPDDTAADHLRLFRHGVLAGLSAVRRVPGAKAEQLPARLLLECLHDREDDVLRFLSDLRIPPTSNQAERDVRPAKTQPKISGRLRSENTTRHRYAIRGYISTAAKHGQNGLTALRDALTGSPWMPPIPDPP